MTEYKLREIQRGLSFAVQPFDAFTGRQTASGRIEAFIEGPHKPPLVKHDGYYVFSDLPEGEYKVYITGSCYFTQTLEARTGGGIYLTRLIPDRRYKITKGTTWLEGRYLPNAEVYVVPSSPTGIKLLRCESGIMTVLTGLPWDLTYRTLAIGECREICFVTERLNVNTYQLSRPLLERHGRNTAVALVSVGRTDNEGYLFCPVAGFLPEQTEAVIMPANDLSAIQFVKTVYGCGNSF